MRKSRRQIVRRVVEAAGVGLVALDLVLYLVAYRPLGERITVAQQHYAQARDRVRSQQARVNRLEKFKAALPQAGALLEDFTAHRASSRRQGFSTAARLVRQVADAAGVQPPNVAYRVESAHDNPLEPLGLEINTGGSFQGLIKFAHGLETANDFILIREFNLGPGDKGVLSLRLVADLYVIP